MAAYLFVVLNCPFKGNTATIILKQGNKWLADSVRLNMNSVVSVSFLLFFYPTERLLIVSCYS